MRNHIYRATYMPPAAAGMRPWTPADIITALWFDAADASTITVDVGVSEWRDKSGNNRHVVQAVGSEQPVQAVQLNGRNVLSFDGRHVLVSSGNTPLGLRDRTLFIVASETMQQASAGILSIAPSTNNDYDSPFGIIVAFDGGAAGMTGVFSVTGSTSLSYEVKTSITGGLAPYAIYNERLTGTVGVAYKNGVTEATDSDFLPFGASSDGPVIIGGRFLSGSVSPGSRLKGNMAEVIYCESALSGADRQKVEGYLAHKWGLAGDLPADHPYKDAPPRKVSLLDAYPGAAAAYSLRQLRAGVAGVVRVRRSSDDAESDFTAEQVSNGALASWVGAADGFVRIWYDQSGNDRHAEQATAANQPLLVSSGTLVTENGRPAIQFPDFGGTTVLESAGEAVASFSALTLFAVFRALDNGSTKFVVSVGPAGATVGITSKNTENIAAYVWGGAEAAEELFAANQAIAVAWFDGTSINLQRNAASPVSATNGSPLGITNNKITLGNDPPGTGLCLNGRLQEVVIYFENRSSQIEGVVGALDSYYGVF